MKSSAGPEPAPPKRKYFPAREKLLSHNRRSPQAEEEEDCVKLSEPAIRHPSLCLPTQDNIWRSQLGRLVEAAAAVDRGVKDQPLQLAA